MAVLLAATAAAAAPQPVTATNITDDVVQLNPWGPGPWVGYDFYDASAYAGTLWSGGEAEIPLPPTQLPNESNQIVAAVLSAPAIPASCDAAEVVVTARISATNEGPTAGVGNDTAFALMSRAPVEILESQRTRETAVGATNTYEVTTTVLASELRSGNIAVSLSLEGAQRAAGNLKEWTVSGFSADYDLNLEECADPAVVVDDAGSTVADTPATIDLQGNDSIPDGSTGWDVDSTTTEGGTVVDNGDGTVTYAPPAGFTGTDTFTYRVTGPDGVEVEATVTVTVTEDPDAGVPLVAGGLAVAGLLGLGGIGAARTIRRRS